MERLVGSWYPTFIDDWPLDEKHFGKDVGMYKDSLDSFYFEFADGGEGQWSLGVMAGTLRVKSGKQSGHFFGEMLVTESEVETLNWRATFTVMLEPKKICRITWTWTCGPAKGVATATYWELAPIVEQEIDRVNRYNVFAPKKQQCSIM